MKFRKLLQLLSERSVVIIAVLIIGVGVLLIFFLVSGFTPSTTQISIGIASISAFFAAISSIANLLQAIETEKQRRNQERPYINAYFDPASSGLIKFVVENSGNSPAKNIEFEIDPVPTDYAGRKLDEVSFYKEPISFIPPGKSFRQMVNVGHQFLAEGNPTKFTITTQYESIHNEHIKETVHQDLEYLKQTTVPGKSIEDNLADISKNISDLYKLLNRVEDFGAFQVETPEQNQKRIQAMINEED